MPEEIYTIPFGQSLPTDTSVATLYTVTNRNKTLRHAVLDSVVVCEVTGTDRTFSIYVDNDGAETWGNGKAIFKDVEIKGNQSVLVECAVVLLADATIGVQSSAGSALNFTGSGREIVTR